MKKEILKTICGVVAAISLVLACGEADTLFNQIIWSGAWLSAFVASAKGFERCLTNEEQEEQV